MRSVCGITERVNGLQKKKRTGIITKVAIVVFSIYAAYILITLQIDINQRKQTNQTLETELVKIESENEALKADIDSELTDQIVAQQAREKLGLVLPGERVFKDTSN